MKKAYTVTLKVEYIVIAEDAIEALEVAKDSIEDVVADVGLYNLIDSSCVNEAAYYPKGWDKTSLPYGTKDDVTVDYFMNQTPAYINSKRSC